MMQQNNDNRFLVNEIYFFLFLILYIIDIGIEIDKKLRL